MATHGLPDWPWTGTPTDDLPPAERLLLDTMRAWHVAARARQTPLSAMAMILATEDAAVAAPPLDSLLRAAPIEAGCLLCPKVTPQEAALLLACALAQRGARSEALAALLRLLPLRSAYAAMPPAIHLGCALRRSGLLLRHPIREALRPRPLARG
ncbi:hypothetical protein [Roseomonas sp. CECT 9278]|uniref:hypothetical protein n=1 Tax=Roseomonas sp. CECT 9278 TaxID=2845823 RepID=UPI001E291FE7|nr:hypothetical protein [Roseomonas sp. CECT 9278]CAH0229336.1 hypothetical protein ROS9278_02612 [Roseomonas sp. CECT 9278]